MLRIAALACWIMLGFASTALAQYAVGDKVVVIRDGELKVEGRKIDDVWAGLGLQVEAVNGRWLWVSNGKPGWLDAGSVIPLDRRAIERLTELIRADPTDPNLYSGRAQIWQHFGEFAIAIGDLNEAIRLEPQEPAGYNDRGNLWADAGEYDRAIADYNEALRLDPKFAGAYHNRGMAWAAMTEHDKAIADYNEALRLDPVFADAYNSRGHAWSQTRQYDKALADFAEVLRLNPTHSRAYEHRGHVWAAKKQYDKAIADYDKAISLNPKDPGMWNARAWLRATCLDETSRDGKRAVEDATEACELSDWKDSAFLDTLAAAYAERGDFVRAVQWQTKAHEAAPETQKADLQTRLELYKAGKPYREEPK